jgi:uncharacterized protein YjdB
VLLGDSAFVNAYVYENGVPVEPRAVAWSVSDSTVATVEVVRPQVAKVVARRDGAATLTASYGGQSATIGVVVRATPPGPATPVAVVRIRPDTSAVGFAAGQRRQFFATAYDSAGTPLARRAFAWGSSDPAVASVDSSGSCGDYCSYAAVSAHRQGQFTLTATSEGKSASLAVTVLPPPAPVALVVISPSSRTASVADSVVIFTAALTDVNGQPALGRAVRWASSDSSVAAVYGAGTTATARPLRAGTVVISATSEAVTGTATLTVR